MRAILAVPAILCLFSCASPGSDAPATSDERFLDSRRRSEIPVEQIQRGDAKASPALDHAPLVRARMATHMTPDEPVFGVEINGDARAYPLRILDRHAVANDKVGGVPVSLTWCARCGAGILYRTDTARGELTFASSGLFYESNDLLVDRQTDTLWSQMSGEPVNGSLAGSGIKLQRLPVVVTSWKAWQGAHPDTRVLSLETGHPIDYAQPKPPEDPLPVLRRSPLLPEKAWVYTLLVNGAPKAYPLDRLAKETVVNDELGGLPVVLVAEPRAEGQGRTVRAYERGDRTFRAGRVFMGSAFLTDQEGRTWRAGEEALTTPDGKSLPRLPGHLAYWFGWFSFYPQTQVYGEAQP
ncbi:MAG TPA: DUF3179 domain-containing protein [Thermoanaerobaculia bacterium]|nr:DUF3179 domain-containing protein [Thermoanaerobaculia bacterium]